MKITTRTIGAMALAIVTISGPGLRAQYGQGRPSVNGPNTISPVMSGTYALDPARSTDPDRTARAATNFLPPAQRERAYQRLMARLDPPDTLSIERRGRTVTIASSRGPGAAFDADGRIQRERGPDGQMISTHAEIVGAQLRVTTTGGNRDTNVTLTIDPVNNGDALRVTRRVDDSLLRGPVSIQTYYRRTEANPRWDVYGRGRGYARGDVGRGGAIGIPGGTRLMATLDTSISMRTSQSGDPFTMTVSSPVEFQGARIDGSVVRVNANRQSEAGRDLRLDFRTVTLRGRQSDFEAFIDSFRLPNGNEVRIDAEGSLQDSNENAANVRNGTIGAALGAIIGAAAGGGKDAAIGAVVGGVGGVVGGMIVSQGHEQLDMPRGTEVRLTSR